MVEPKFHKLLAASSILASPSTLCRFLRIGVITRTGSTLRNMPELLNGSRDSDLSARKTPLSRREGVEVPMVWSCGIVANGTAYRLRSGSFESSSLSSTTTLWRYRISVSSPHSQCEKLGSIPSSATTLWPHPLSARSAPFQGEKPGSIPGGATIYTQNQLYIGIVGYTLRSGSLVFKAPVS